MATDTPFPFPEGLPTLALPRISLAKLLGGDEAEAETMLNICSRTGFFYLNLMDHPNGKELWKSVCFTRQIGENLISSLSLEKQERVS